MTPIVAEPDAQEAIALELIDRSRPWAAVDLLVTIISASGQGEPAPDVGLVEAALLRAATRCQSDDTVASRLRRSLGRPSNCSTTSNARAP